MWSRTLHKLFVCYMFIIISFGARYINVQKWLIICIYCSKNHLLFCLKCVLYFTIIVELNQELK